MISEFREGGGRGRKGSHGSRGRMLKLLEPELSYYKALASFLGSSGVSRFINLEGNSEKAVFKSKY